MDSTLCAMMELPPSARRSVSLDPPMFARKPRTGFSKIASSPPPLPNISSTPRSRMTLLPWANTNVSRPSPPSNSMEFADDMVTWSSPEPPCSISTLATNTVLPPAAKCIVSCPAPRSNLPPWEGPPRVMMSFPETAPHRTRISSTPTSVAHRAASKSTRSAPPPRLMCMGPLVNCGEPADSTTRMSTPAPPVTYSTFETRCVPPAV